MPLKFSGKDHSYITLGNRRKYFFDCLTATRIKTLRLLFTLALILLHRNTGSETQQATTRNSGKHFHNKLLSGTYNHEQHLVVHKTLVPRVYERVCKVNHLLEEANGFSILY